ncbi:alpha-(1,3)-fucosyltransferase C-like [Gordionus sp. m RMFG-2023]|uniref:alpha-(1,3)-fucosyltransferase C-like n=1 Tax=Gordionus sp. m RMFG-2023 TaxID=3053472 RepID=UPI0031FDDB80
MYILTPNINYNQTNYYMEEYGGDYENQINRQYNKKYKSFNQDPRRIYKEYEHNKEKLVSKFVNRSFKLKENKVEKFYSDIGLNFIKQYCAILVRRQRFILQTCFNKLNYIDFTSFTQEVKRLEKPQIIVFWSEKQELSFINHSFEKCKVKNCIIVPNNPYFFQFADAILFILKKKQNKIYFPVNFRKTHQKWIFYDTEPPNDMNINQNLFNGVFNWTMSYRKDSDIHIPWGLTTKKSSLTNLEHQNIDFNEAYRLSLLIKKSKIKTNARTCWFVSHCWTKSLRERIARELGKYIPLDIYGTCGNKICSSRTKKRCQRMVERNCKFYLAFENQLCKDYVTEKAFDTLSLNVVPIVYGAVDYSKVLPPHSYINVYDFDSMSSLANYLLMLDDSPSEYLSYFRWKNTYDILRPDPFCELCSKLNEKSSRFIETIYDRFDEWWFGPSKNPVCKSLYLSSSKISNYLPKKI